MRKETDAIKRKFTQQVQDLRRQLVTKKSFDEEDAHKEITRLRREITFLSKASTKKAKQIGSKENDENVSSKASNMAQQRSEFSQSQKRGKNTSNQNVLGGIRDNLSHSHYTDLS